MDSRKKKVLIVNNNLETGGVQRSLINLINQIKDNYDITLFVFAYSGDYTKLIPAQVNVIRASSLLRILGMSQAQTKNIGFSFYIIRAILALYTKFFSNHLPISLLVSTEKRLSGFDVAISFLHNSEENSLYGGCNEFVLKKVDAKQKITFSHCDFSNYGGNTSGNKAVYRQFDKIAAVSEGCRQSMIKAIPDLAEKVHSVYNCHNYSEYIYNSNDNPIKYPADNLNIVTVARLSPEKGILRGIDVIKRLINEGYRVRWYIVGGGPQQNEIENEIRNKNLSGHITLLGNQENPYRYIKNADLFFLPSFHEAAPMVFDEAKCLGVPIVTTKTTSAKEMVKEGQEGIVCENNEEGIYLGIKKALDSPNFINKCREYLSKQKFTNKTATEQFKRLISDEGL